MKTSIFAIALLTAAVTAVPFTPANTFSRRDSTPDPRSVAIITEIAPTSTSCAGAQFPSECATATEATQPLLDSFAKYGINTAGEQVALLAWMDYESGDFKYVKSHFPTPTPGKGTRCMMSPTYVSQYAQSIGVTGSDPDSILDAVIAAPDGEWGAASWFLTSQCSSDIRSGLQKGDQAGFNAFMTSCVSTTMNDDRLTVWKRAAQAFGLSGQ